MHRNQVLIEEVLRLHGTHDIDALLSHFADNVVYEDVALARKSTDRAGTRELFQELFQQIPDFHSELVSVLVTETSGAVEYVQRGTHLGEGFGYPATGKPIVIRTAAIIRFDQGLVTHWSDYWSWSDFLKQAGLA